jgi:hypothetical protein
MTLPCKSENDHCWRSKPCRYRRELDNGLRTPEWVEARCETLAVRREGFVEVDADLEAMEQRRVRPKEVEE